MLFVFYPVVTLVVKGFKHFNLEVTLKQPWLLWHCLEPKEEYWEPAPPRVCAGVCLTFSRSPLPHTP